MFSPRRHTRATLCLGSEFELMDQSLFDEIWLWKVFFSLSGSSCFLLHALFKSCNVRNICDGLSF